MKLKSGVGILITVVIITLLASFMLVSYAQRQNMSVVDILQLPSRHILRDGSVIRGVNTRKKVVAFTFDADVVPGERATYDKRIVDTLRARQVPATLFLTGRWIEAYPELSAELAADPLFELANHSYSHPGFKDDCFGLPEVPDSQDFTEIKKTEKLLDQYAGEGNYKKYFRFPEFCYEPYDLEVAGTLGYLVVHGNIPGRDTLFWEPTTDKIVDEIMASTTPGGIIILHMQGAPSAPYTASALPKIIDNLESEGYKFMKVSELLKIR